MRRAKTVRAAYVNAGYLRNASEDSNELGEWSKLFRFLQLIATAERLVRRVDCKLLSSVLG
jgi:hypothetical protein